MTSQSSGPQEGNKRCTGYGVEWKSPDAQAKIFVSTNAYRQTEETAA